MTKQLIDDECEVLRNECEVLRVQLRRHKRGSCEVLADAIGVNSNSLNMALSGLRTGPASKRTLETLKTYLISLSQSEGDQLPTAVNG